jgi:hypothetical protein
MRALSRARFERFQRLVTVPLPAFEVRATASPL